MHDFMYAAFPWIFMGLAVAIVTAYFNENKIFKSKK